MKASPASPPPPSPLAHHRAPARQTHHEGHRQAARVARTTLGRNSHHCRPLSRPRHRTFHRHLRSQMYVVLASTHRIALTIITGQPLLPAWTGKLWALSQGVAQADRLGPDYLLFTDADIDHDPNSVAELVGIAETRGLDLASCALVKLASATPPRKLPSARLSFFSWMLYPPRWIASERSKTAAAAGGCILIRPEALRKLRRLGSHSRRDHR